MRLLQSILSIAGLTPKPSQPFLSSDHPASIQFSAWLSAFNTGDRETIKAYHTDLAFPMSVLETFPEVPGIDHELVLAQMTGGFDVAKVEPLDDPSFVVVVVKEKDGHRQHYRVNMTVDISRPTFPTTKFERMPIVTPLDLIREDDPRRPVYENALLPLTPSRRQAVINGVLNVLQEQYVDASVGEKVKAAIEANFKSGKYESISDNEEFATQLSRDMREYDKYLFVGFYEPQPEREGSDSGPAPQKQMEQLRKMNFGFWNTSFDTESAPGYTIATLPINVFIPIDKRYVTDTDEIRNAVAERISSVADADALIIDLRNNYFGDFRAIAFMESYLMDNAPLNLLDILFRNGTVDMSISSLPIEELPAGSKRYGGTKPLFVLTGNTTTGAGEGLAYSLQAFKRTQAVIGQANDATAGVANQIASVEFIAEEVFGEQWWFVGVPSLRPVHTVTGSNWQGVGVKSDVVAGQGEWEGEEDAKRVATQLAVRALHREKEL